MIVTTIRDRVAVIVLDRPHQLNALTRTMVQSLWSTFQTLGADDAVRAIVLTGSGAAFSAGQALDDPDTLPKDRPNSLASAIAEGYNPLLRAMFGCGKPMVAAVNGVAAGAGFALACACDFRIVSDQASFTAAFAKIGLVPDCGLALTLPRIVGYARALEICLLSDRIDAATAQAYGLCTKVVPGASIMQEAEGLARRLASGSRHVNALTKLQLQRCALENIDATLELELEHQALAAASPDLSEGVAAFREKRPPRFA